MASRTRPADLLRQLDPGPAADADLLGRFAAARDQAAFAELVRRHGPLVLGVLRRVVGHPDDADDAFQAVFLTLARKAGAVGRPDLLGNWLYGVAVRVGRRARRSALRRRRREVSAVNAPEPATTDGTPFEAGPELYEELDRLPAWYRDAVLLCDLQGLSRAEGAKRLGIPEGTLSSRLAGGRKRLADALARRGVALTAALVPVALGVGPGTAAVPDDLITKTCGLVADWAAGAAVPVPVARLADGGFSMTKLLLAGTVGLAVASAGLMAAGGRGDDPPKPADPPKVAEKTAAKEGPKADGKGVAFTDRPRLRRAIDLDFPAPGQVVWSPNGAALAVRGDVPPPAPAAGGLGGGPQNLLAVYSYPVAEDNPRIGFQGLDLPSRLVGFTPDGKRVITDLRESGLVSGKHQLFYTNVDGFNEGNRRVDLDPDPTAGYAFAPDGKTFRTVYTEATADRPGRVEVREVSTETGRAVKVSLAAEGAFTAVALSANGKRLAGITADDRVTMYDVGAGKPLWSKVVDLKQPYGRGSQPQPHGLGLSPDGGRLVVSQTVCVPALLDGATGETAADLEGAEFLQMLPQPGSFSADGRLFAASGSRVVRREEPGAKLPGGKGEGRPRVVLANGGNFLTVWDTRTGKAVKSWKGSGDVAFHPSTPVLAILEPNGDFARLGLWDFAAEVPEKK